MTWSPTDDQLVCRDLQHSWVPYTARSEGSGWVRVLVCNRCSSQKVQTLDSVGYIVSSQMKYPEGYLRPEGRLSRMERATLRLRNLS